MRCIDRSCVRPSRRLILCALRCPCCSRNRLQTAESSDHVRDVQPRDQREQPEHAHGLDEMEDTPKIDRDSQLVRRPEPGSMGLKRRRENQIPMMNARGDPRAWTVCVILSSRDTGRTQEQRDAAKKPPTAAQRLARNAKAKADYDKDKALYHCSVSFFLLSRRHRRMNARENNT